MSHPLNFADIDWHLLGSGALFWPEAQLLCVSDLHLGKAERIARRGGGLLPPYDSQETLERLDRELERSKAKTVICLGDSFDDIASLDGLGESERLWLNRMIAGREWIWIEGNHDAGPMGIAGSHRKQVTLHGITFRHIADNDEKGPEISGHYHPKARLLGKAWPCFLSDYKRLIMPAFGAYTGGMAAQSPEITSLMGPEARAYLCMNQTVRVIPMPRTGLRR